MSRFRPPAIQLPFDLARWAFDTTFREGLPADEPEVLRLLAGLGWRVEARMTAGRWALTVDEVRRTFGVSVRTAESAAREAYDLSLQSRMEGLVVPRLDAAALGAFVRVNGAISGPALVLYPHAGNLLLLVAALAVQHPGLVVFSARGVPPKAMRATGAIRATLVNRHLAARHGEEEERLAVRWVSSVAAVEEALAAGGIVAAAFDDRAWPEWSVGTLLGRESLLSPDPWRIAKRAGVPVVPAFIRREHDKTHRVTLLGAIEPARSLYLHDIAEPWLRENPGHYGSFLAECRLRAALDDHPLFTDYAPDARWARWATPVGAR